MNGNRETDLHYVDTDFPYTHSGSLVDFFGGINHVPVNYAPPVMPMHDQDNLYWSMNMNAYKFGYSDPGSTSYYGPYDANYTFPRMDMGRSGWEYPSMINAEDPTTTELQSDGDTVVDVNPVAEERIPDYPSSSSPQDDIDPDNMTYEELLDLGEAVGTQSRGLSPELISLLPTSKCKLGNFFSRKKSSERCVICQMRYKRGDRQTRLPCNHIYHSECITKWLSINKVCPVCNNEVFGEESRN